jgi:hypothetical protein
MVTTLRPFAVLAAFLAICLSACGSSTLAETERDTVVAEGPRGVDRFAAARLSVDRQGVAADCSNLLSDATETAWLAAWCNLRTSEFGALESNARRAQRYFGESGEIRRSAESWLLVAIAHAEGGDVDQTHAALERAADLIRWGELDPIGDRDDVYASDLAYLVALLTARGFIVPGQDWSSRDELLSHAAYSDTFLSCKIEHIVDEGFFRPSWFTEH